MLGVGSPHFARMPFSQKQERQPIAGLAGVCPYANFYDNILGRFSNVNNFRLEVASDVISSVVVNSTGMNVRVKLGDSRSNRS